MIRLVAVTLFAFGTLIVSHQTARAEDVKSCESDKSLIAEFAVQLNSLNLEFAYKIMADPRSREDVCFRLGEWKRDISTYSSRWSDYESHLCQDASEELVSKVSAFLSKTRRDAELLTGYCTSFDMGKSYVKFRDDADFARKFENHATDILNFQWWAWYELQGKQTSETVLQRKLKWLGPH